MLYSGKVEGTMKYTPVNTDKSLNGGWSMVQFYGYVGTKFESLFALRTNNDKKIQLVFSYESFPFIKINFIALSSSE